MLLGTKHVNQLELGVKDFVALIENVSSMRINPFLKIQPLGSTVPCPMGILIVLVTMVSPGDIHFSRFVGRLA